MEYPEDESDTSSQDSNSSSKLRTCSTSSQRSQASDTSSRHGPASYSPSLPQPIMSGYMEKRSGEGHKKYFWRKKYIEVSEGTFRIFNSREEKETDTEVTVKLADSFVSVDSKKNVRLESKSGVRVFRASSELKAQTWVYVISRFCAVAPTAEGFCRKLSGGKNIREERYLRLRADGILSWYKTEKDDAECRGAIQVRGQGISLEATEPNILYVDTEGRCYLFEFSDKSETKLWFDLITWHSHRISLDCSSVHVRNASRRK